MLNIQNTFSTFSTSLICNRIIPLLPSVSKLARENNINLTDNSIIATGPKGNFLKSDILNFIKNGPTLNSTKTNNKNSLATPFVRKIAKDLNINIDLVEGTGKFGRVEEKDLKNFIENQKKQKQEKLKKKKQEKEEVKIIEKQTKQQKEEEVSTKPKYQEIKLTNEEISKLTKKITITKSTPENEGDKFIQVKGVLKGMVKSMTESTKIPHLGYQDEFCVDNLKTLRSQLKQLLQNAKPPIKLSFLPFIIKAASLAMHDYPIINSLLSDDEKIVILRKTHNIGIAMDTPQGLIVPNIKNVENKSIIEIAQDLNNLVKKGEAGKISLSDLKDTSFTISNIGTVGGTYVHPIMTSEESTIMALGKFLKVPRYNEKDELIPTSIVNVSYCCDHRIVDGASIARFAEVMRKYIEKPETMLCSLK